MAQCYRCKAETQMFFKNIPICVKCDAEPPAPKETNKPAFGFGLRDRGAERAKVLQGVATKVIFIDR